jgi:hypothetical protein
MGEGEHRGHRPSRKRGFERKSEVCAPCRVLPPT